MGLNRRMKLMLAALGVIVLGIVWPVWNGFMQNVDRSRAQVRQAQIRLQQAQELRDRISEDRRAAESLEKNVKARGSNFDLYSYVDERLREHKVAATITSRGGSSSGRAMQAVNVEFTDVQVSKFIDVMHHVYHGRNLVVLDRLSHLRRSKSGNGVDCEITFISPQS